MIKLSIQSLPVSSLVIFFKTWVYFVGKKKSGEMMLYLPFVVLLYTFLAAKIAFLYTFNECILGLFTCWNVNHHSVLSTVILIMLIIVTVSSQDTALYIKLHWIHFCYCTQGLKYLPFLKESTLNEYNICQI